MLKRVISGGQTGIDRAGLQAALQSGLKTGGKAPEGYKTEAGHDLSLQTIYGLTAPEGGTYVSRTIDNIKGSDGTLVFWAVTSPGTDGTISYCHTGKWNGNYNDRTTRNVVDNAFRPVFVISYEQLQKEKQTDDWQSLGKQVVDFITVNSVETLNIAGHRGSRCPEGFVQMVQDFLAAKVFAEKHNCQSLLHQAKKLMEEMKVMDMQANSLMEQHDALLTAVPTEETVRESARLKSETMKLKERLTEIKEKSTKLATLADNTTCHVFHELNKDELRQLHDSVKIHLENKPHLA